MLKDGLECAAELWLFTKQRFLDLWVKIKLLVTLPKNIVRWGGCSLPEFSPFPPQCFLKRNLLDMTVNPFPNKPLFLRVCSASLLRNTVRKGEIALNEQFLFFPTAFSTGMEKFLPISLNAKLLPANTFNLVYSKNCRLGKG